MSKVHDNIILSYEVNLQTDQIIIHTNYDYNGNIEETDIVFVDVLNHMFQHQLKGSIILDIIDLEISDFIKDNSSLLEANKQYCWPTVFNTIKDLEDKLNEQGYRYITLMSSYGLNGWVLAKKYEIITRTINGS